jgi:hypothetical protein
VHRIVLLRISPGIITAALCPLFVPGLPREVLPLSYGITVGKDLAGKSVPFESRAQPARQRVLVKAESTGVCPNSSEPRDSVAGPSFREDGFEAQRKKCHAPGFPDPRRRGPRNLVPGTPAANR